MESLVVKAAAHERDVGDGIEVGQYADPVHNHDFGFRACLPDDVGAKAGVTSPGDRARRMRSRRFVCRDHHPRAGHALPHYRPGAEQFRFVRRPRRSGDQRRSW